MAADRLLHGAFEGLVGGGDRQEEVSGAQLPPRRKPLLRPPLPAPLRRVKEGDAGSGEEAAGGRLSGSCGKVEEVLQGDAAPPS